ncbi:MAG: hypothetical protein N2578_09660, partial [Bdellovibrionaceae bacterium]|nr:hypothetical protein [Pseudobdellovibrionaceae bacterium]
MCIRDRPFSQAVVQGQNFPLERRKLWLPSVMMASVDDRFTNRGLELSYELRTNPEIRLTKISGEEFGHELSSGKFDAEFFLIHYMKENGKESRRVLLKSTAKDVEIRNKTLLIRVPALITEIPQRGFLYVGLILHPHGELSALKPYEGVFAMGDVSQIKAMAWLRLSHATVEKEEFQLANFVNDKSPMGHSENRDVFLRAKVLVKYLNFEFVNVTKQTATHNSFRYRRQICLESPITGELFRRHKIIVTDENGRHERTTDEFGCAYVENEITYDVYACQHWLQKNLRVTNADLGLDEKISYLINPWETRSMRAWDQRRQDKPETLRTSCDKKEAPRSVLRLKDYHFTTQSIDVKVENNLNLASVKRVRFVLTPEVVVFSSLDRGIEETGRPLRPGVYLLRVLLIRNKDYTSENEYVTHVDKLVLKTDEQIQENLEFISHDLRAMGNRNHVLVQLLPVRSELVQLHEDGQVRP